jgi:hypothetical protein
MRACCAVRNSPGKRRTRGKLMTPKRPAEAGERADTGHRVDDLLTDSARRLQRASSMGGPGLEPGTSCL